MARVGAHGRAKPDGPSAVRRRSVAEGSRSPNGAFGGELLPVTIDGPMSRDASRAPGRRIIVRQTVPTSTRKDVRQNAISESAFWGCPDVRTI